MKCVLNADEYMLIEQGLSELEKIMKRNLFSPENRLEGKVYFKEWKRRFNEYQGHPVTVYMDEDSKKHLDILIKERSE